MIAPCIEALSEQSTRLHELNNNIARVEEKSLRRRREQARIAAMAMPEVQELNHRKRRRDFDGSVVNGFADDDATKGFAVNFESGQLSDVRKSSNSTTCNYL